MSVDTNSSSDDESSSIANDYPFVAVLGDDGRESLDMIFRHVGGLVDEIKVHITDDGWWFRPMDPATVAMVDVNIPSTVFSEYDCAQDITVGIDVSELNDALTADERIRYDANGDSGPLMYVGDTEIMCIDPKSVRMEPDIPDLDLPSTAVIENIEVFNHFIDAMPSDHVQISMSENGVACHADGDTDSATLLLENGRDVDVREHARKDATRTSVDERPSNFHDGANKDVSLFSQDYLVNAFDDLLVKHTRGVSYELKCGTEFPMYLTRIDETDVSITVMLAPRINAN